MNMMRQQMSGGMNHNMGGNMNQGWNGMNGMNGMNGGMNGGNGGNGGMNGGMNGGGNSGGIMDLISLVLLQNMYVD